MYINIYTLYIHTVAFICSINIYIYFYNHCIYIYYPIYEKSYMARKNMLSQLNVFSHKVYDPQLYKKNTAEWKCAW